MNEKIGYLADRRKRLIKSKINPEELRSGSEKYELHHPVGRNNSKEKEPLCKHCHRFISEYQNNLSVKERKKLRLLALQSILGMLELITTHLRMVIEKMRQDGK